MGVVQVLLVSNKTNLLLVLNFYLRLYFPRSYSLKKKQKLSFSLLSITLMDPSGKTACFCVFCYFFSFFFKVFGESSLIIMIDIHVAKN